jgi:hypothetical protein
MPPSSSTRRCNLHLLPRARIRPGKVPGRSGRPFRRGSITPVPSSVSVQRSHHQRPHRWPARWQLERVDQPHRPAPRTSAGSESWKTRVIWSCIWSRIYQPPQHQDRRGPLRGAGPFPGRIADPTGETSPISASQEIFGPAAQRAYTACGGRGRPVVSEEWDRPTGCRSDSERPHVPLPRPRSSLKASVSSAAAHQRLAAGDVEIAACQG